METPTLKCPNCKTEMSHIGIQRDGPTTRPDYMSDENRKEKFLCEKCGKPMDV